MTLSTHLPAPYSLNTIQDPTTIHIYLNEIEHIRRRLNLYERTLLKRLEQVVSHAQH